MNKLKFFLTIGVLGFLIIVIGGFLITAGRTIGQSIFGRSFAEGQLRDYVTKVTRQEVNGVQCQAVDTNKNGYVSCEYTTTGRPEMVQSTECAAWGLDGFFNRGCRTRVQTFENR